MRTHMYVRELIRAARVLSHRGFVVKVVNVIIVAFLIWVVLEDTSGVSALKGY